MSVCVLVCESISSMGMVLGDYGSVRLLESCGPSAERQASPNQPTGPKRIRETACKDRRETFTRMAQVTRGPIGHWF